LYNRFYQNKILLGGFVGNVLLPLLGGMVGAYCSFEGRD